MLKLLGQSEYGLYKIATSTTSYLSLMTFGLGAAVSRYLIKANVERGKAAEENVFGLFNLIFSIITFLTLLVGGILVLCLDVLYGESLTNTEMIRMKILVAIMVVNTAVGFSATAYNSEVTSHERFVFIQLLNILSTIVVPIINLVILFMGYRSIGMTVVSLVINVIIRILYVVYVRKALGLRPRYKNMPFPILKEVLFFSFWIFVSTIVSRINTSTDLIVIGAIPELATTGAAVYSVGYTFSSIMFSLAQASSSVFMPKANKLVFSGCSDEELSNLVIKVGRIQSFVVVLVCSGFIAFGRQFLEFYAGPEYYLAYWVAIIIMIPDCIPLTQSVANSIIQAKNKHSFRALVYLGIALLNVVGTILLTKQYGIVGAAIPTGLSYVIGQGLIMNWYYWKKIHLDIPRFWKNLLPIIVIGGLLCCITLIISNWIDFFEISCFFVGVFVYVIAYCICLWKIVFNREEKALICGIFNKIFKKKQQE